MTASIVHDGMAAIALMLAVVATTATAREGPRGLGGTIVDGSLACTESGSRFVIRLQWGDWPDRTARYVRVAYPGNLPVTACGGTAVYLEGQVSGDHFDATRISAFNNGRYDACWDQRCLPDARRTPRCRGDFGFK